MAAGNAGYAPTQNHEIYSEGRAKLPPFPARFLLWGEPQNAMKRRGAIHNVKPAKPAFAEMRRGGVVLNPAPFCLAES
jgi:hypothetical protein